MRRAMQQPTFHEERTQACETQCDASANLDVLLHAVPNFAGLAARAPGIVRRRRCKSCGANKKAAKRAQCKAVQGYHCPWWRDHVPFFTPREAMRVRCGARLCGAEAGAFSAQPLCLWNSGASRGYHAQEGCAVAFDMVDAHTGSPPCRKAVHSKACALRGAGTLGAARRLCIAPIAIRCESCQKHDRKGDRCGAGELGASAGHAVRQAAAAVAVHRTPLPGHTPSRPVHAVRCEVCPTTLQGEGVAVGTNSGQAHRTLHSPKCVQSLRGACHSHRSFAARVENHHGEAVQVQVAGLAVQCWELLGPSRRHSPGRGGAVHSHHLRLLRVAVRLAVLGEAHCFRPGHRWTTPVRRVQCPR